MNASYDALFRIVTGILSLTTKDLVPDELVSPKHINMCYVRWNKDRMKIDKKVKLLEPAIQHQPQLKKPVESFMFIMRACAGLSQTAEIVNA